MKHKTALIAIAVLLCGLLIAPAAQAQENPGRAGRFNLPYRRV